MGKQRWSRVTGGRSRVAAAGSQRRQDCDDVVGPGLGGGGVPAVGNKGGGSRVPAVHTIVLVRRAQAVQAR